MSMPRLTIPGAILRPWAHSDADVLVQAWQDPDIAAWNPVPPDPTLSTATTWIDGVIERSTRRLALDWVIEIETSQEPGARGVVGEVGLSGFSTRHRGALIGYWLLPQARGQGLAATAVQEVAAWAHANCDVDVLVARCHETNHASQRVAERAGFVLGGVDSQDHQLWRSHQ